MKLIKGDSVIVVAGKDKGKKGKIHRVLPRENKVIIEGINVTGKHQRPRKSGEKGSVVKIAMPIHASNVQILDPKTDKPTRIGRKIVGGKTVRIARGSKQEI